MLAAALRSRDFDVTDKFVDAFLSDEVNISPVSSEQDLLSKLRTRLQDQAIAKAKASLPTERFSFGRYIEAIRERAKISRADVASRIKCSLDLPLRLERGDISPCSLHVGQLADFVVLFAVSIGDVSNLLITSVLANEEKVTYRASARSHGGVRTDVRSEDVERALDAFARKMAQKQASGSAAVPEEVRTCLFGLEAELRRRGRIELLK